MNKLIILFLLLVIFVQTYEKKYMLISWKRKFLVPEDRLTYETSMLARLFNATEGGDYFGQL